MQQNETNERWGYSTNEGEWYSGDFRTREEAIAEGRGCCPGEGFYIARGHKCAAVDFMPDADDVIELMGERAADEIGDPAEGFPVVGHTGKPALDKLLNDWAAMHIDEPNFWLGDGHVERIEATGSES